MKTEPITPNDSEQYLRLLRVQVEQRLRMGERRVACQILAEHSQFLDDQEAVLELVYAEISTLEEIGCQVDAAYWVDDFPEIQGRICNLLEVHHSLNDGEPEEATGSYQGNTECDVNARLEMLEELGRGGMGVVYRARQIAIGRVVAVKMIRVVDPDAATYRRFKQEAESAARLQHPHIVQIYEVGEMQGRPFLAMEYLEGGSLDSLLARQPLSTADSVGLMIKLCEAVHFAHTQGIIHRDLKPANILLTRSGEPKVSDFGVAKWLDSQQSSTTQSGVLLGTPAYMAPEQAEAGTESSPLSDVYSLGAILYEMCCGRAPFHANTVLETLQQVRMREPMPLRKLTPEISRDLETICLKCLEKSPSLRYDSAACLAEDLLRFQRGDTILAARANLLERSVKQVRRRPWISALIMTTLAVAALGMCGIAWQWRRANRQTQVAIEQKETAVVHQRHAEESRDEALQAVQQADRNFRKAEQLVESLLELSSQLRGRPGSEPLRQVALSDAIEAFSEFAEGQQVHPSVSRLISRAQLRLAELQQMSGRYGLADETFLRGLRLADMLVGASADTNDYKTAAADAHFRYGLFIVQTTGNKAAALEQFQFSRDLYSQVADSDPSDSNALDRLGDTLGRVCSTWSQPLVSAASGDMLHEALRLQIRGLRRAEMIEDGREVLEWVARSPWENSTLVRATDLSDCPRLNRLGLAKQLFSLSLTIDHIGERQRQLGHFEVALNHLRSALEIRDFLESVLAGDQRFDAWHARSHSRIARVLHQQGDWTAAAKSMETATNRFSQLNAQNPIQIEITTALMYCYFQSASMHGVLDQASYRLLVERVEGLLRQYDDPADHRHEFDRQLCVIMRRQGELLLEAGQPVLAEVSLRHANRLASRLHLSQSDEYVSIVNLAQARAAWAAALLGVSSRDDAIKSAREAVLLCDDLERRFPEARETAQHQAVAASILAMSTLAADDLQVARLKTEQVVRVQPEDLICQCYFAWMVALSSNATIQELQHAAERARQSLRLDPANIPSQQALAICLYRTRENKDAREVIEANNDAVGQLGAVAAATNALVLHELGDLQGARTAIQEFDRDQLLRLLDQTALSGAVKVMLDQFDSI